MAFRSDVTVDFNTSPRIIEIAAPSTTITQQDLVDTLRELEARPEALQYPSLLSAAGKEDLGAGLQVGITTTLLDALLSFQARLTSVSSGTVTSASTTSLIDSAATFVTDGVRRGSVIHNADDNHHADVLAVVSETELSVLHIVGGAENDYDVGESYEVFNIDQCTVTGGNLVALDNVGNPVNPIFPTFGTQVVISQSTSAAILNLSDITSDVASILSEVTRTRKFTTNRATVGPVDGASPNPTVPAGFIRITIYEDDETTIHAEFDVRKSDSIGLRDPL